MGLALGWRSGSPVTSSVGDRLARNVLGVPIKPDPGWQREEEEEEEEGENRPLRAPFIIDLPKDESIEEL